MFSALSKSVLKFCTTKTLLAYERKISYQQLRMLIITLTQIKSSRHYTRGIKPECVTSDGVHLRGLAPGQHRNVTSVASRSATVSDLTGPGIDPKTSHTDSNVFHHYFNRREKRKSSCLDALSFQKLWSQQLQVYYEMNFIRYYFNASTISFIISNLT